MMGTLSNLATWLLNVLNQIFNLYSGNIILSAFFVLWVMDRLFGIFDLLKRR